MCLLLTCLKVLTFTYLLLSSIRNLMNIMGSTPPRYWPRCTYIHSMIVRGTLCKYFSWYMQTWHIGCVLIYYLRTYVFTVLFQGKKVAKQCHHQKNLHHQRQPPVLLMMKNLNLVKYPVYLQGSRNFKVFVEVTYSDWNR